jgi:aminomethyltransferase
LLSNESGVGENDEVRVDVRGRRSAVRVVKPPFVELHVR